MMNFVLGLVYFGTLAIFVEGLDNANAPNQISPNVPITLIAGADKKGAVCLDGSLPAYHWDRGSGSGANSWLIDLEGGAWCMDANTCASRKMTPLGSSKFMGPDIPFFGIQSSKREDNPDFFNWNRVRVRYCDGASFAGDGQDEAHQLFFRGQRIWTAAMEDLMAKGMSNAEQVLLCGCSAGGLAAILHCDQFKDLFPSKTKVKCMSDAGYFLDTKSPTGAHFVRDMFTATVNYMGVAKTLPSYCTAKMDPTSCFFPQNLIGNMKTPLFILNPAYDFYQSMNIVPADPDHQWDQCKKDHKQCSSSQMQIFQDLRLYMIDTLNKGFSKSPQNGHFINSCFTHCEADPQDAWLAPGSPIVGNKTIAKAVGDWYFDREPVKIIECPYPCGNNCRNMW